MNWKLILQLSLFGLAMGLATVFFIPSNIEPVFWLAIFVFCAYAIARGSKTRRFAHGVTSAWRMAFGSPPRISSFSISTFRRTRRRRR